MATRIWAHPTIKEKSEHTSSPVRVTTRPILSFTPDVFTDATHPLGISIDGFSVPIQNPFNPFTVADYTSPGGFDPNHPETKVSAAPPGTGFTTSVRYAALEAGLRSDKITTHNYEFTGGIKGTLGESGDYFRT